MELKRTSHAVYDTKYHLVWTPKYRKWILRGDIREKAKRIFEEISGNHGFEIDTMEVVEDHVHIFLSFPPRYSIARVVGMLKSISASVIFKEHPEVKKELWGGEFWEDGYFARTVGDRVTADTIRKYIEYHHGEENSPQQLKFF
jgi:putative transposase